MVGDRLEDYPRPSVTADTVLFAVSSAVGESCAGSVALSALSAGRLELLLIRRGREPYQGSWALPGGFAQADETLREAAARELEEETGVHGCHLKQIYTFSEPGRDPRGWVITSVYLALASKESLTVQAAADAADAAWFTISYEETDATERKLTLTLTRADTDTRLTASLRLTDDEPQIVESNGLAFDHAKIIACALEHLRDKGNAPC
jgi:ADP-ribose pyrophosphatase YjhB (NUDIX family)